MSIQIVPGTKVTVVAGERAAELAVTGIVSMPLEMDWGDLITEIYNGDSTLTRLGYNLSDVKLKCVNEVMNYADKLILYRSNMTGGVKATGTVVTGITATAKYVGTRGNDISVVVTASGSNWKIQTLLGTTEVDSQIVADSTKFVANDFISLSGTGTLAAATVKLTGGTNGSIQTTTADDFMAQMEKYEFNVIAYPGSGTTTRQKIVDFVNTERQKNVMIQAVVSGLAADNEAVYNNTIGGVTENYTLTAAEATATIAGIIAKQGITGSLTHYQITGWTDVSDNLTYEEQETHIQAGEIFAAIIYGVPSIVYDQNSLVTYTSAKPKDFHMGLIVRTLDNYAVSLQKLLDLKAIGKIRNSENGRSQIKTMVNDMTVANYLNKGYVEDFTADDITIVKGTDSDAVTATVAIQAVDTVDKIQITVTSVA